VSVPFTRTLPYVLREQLQGQQGTGILIGNVVSVPDRAHVRVDILGTQVTIPKLASYTDPKVGEAALVLADPLVTAALGAVSPTVPPTGNADTLDGIDSTGFVQVGAVPGYLQRQQPGATERVWWQKTAAATSDAGGTTVHAHPLGRVPQICLAVADNLASPAGAAVTRVDAGTATQFFLVWNQVNKAGLVAHVLLIG